MRRINQIISGHNYYRKANEILFTDQQTGSLGCLDEIKNCPDGARLDHRGLLKPFGSNPYPDSEYPVAGTKGILFTAPVTTDNNKRIFLTNVTFTGLFDFQFDVTVVSIVGTSSMLIGCVRLYTNWPNTDGYWDTYLYNQPVWDGHSSLMMPTDGSGWGDSVLGGSLTTKKRLIRTGMTTYNLYGYAGGGWRIHDWGTGATKTNAYGKTVRLAFFHQSLSTSQYATAVMNNFVLNSGQTQIEW